MIQRYFCAALVALVLPVVLPAQPRVAREPDGRLRILEEPAPSPTAVNASIPGDEHWDERFGAIGQGLGVVSVTAVAVTPTKIYVGGTFSEINGIEANNIAVYDRASGTWSPIVDGGYNGTNGTVSAIVTDGETVFVGGQFRRAGGIGAIGVARYDGSRWYTAGLGLSDRSRVYALTLYKGELYAAGDLQLQDGFNLVRLDGQYWEPLGVTSGGFMSALAVYGDELVVGGLFVRVGDSLSSGALAWNGERWRALVDRTTDFDMIRDFAVSSSGELYATGNFAGSDVGDVVRYDGTTWQGVGGRVGRGRSGLQASIEAIAIAPNGDIYVGGDAIDSAGGTAVIDIARYDGTRWSDIGGVYYGVDDLAFAGDDLVVAGSFTRVGTVEAHGLAIYGSGEWSALGNVHESGGRVFSIARAPGGDMYVGGNFQTAGGVAVNNVARWDGTAWHPLGTGTNGDAYAMHVDASGTLYIGGWMAYVTHAGSAQTENIALWNGSSWSAHPGVWRYANQLMSITSNRHGLFVAGGATTPDNVQLGPVMHWNGEAWRSLGGNPIAWIRGLMALGDDVYAVGQFDSIGGTTARNIAVWNGERWNALGDGVDMGPFGSVAAITVWRDDIVVGGSPAVGTLPNLARFDLDARTWLPMPHLDGFVNALTTVGDDLYLTGYFDVDGSQHIARYDGTALTGLGSGLNAQGYALAADRTGKLHVGGMFTAAGGKDAYAFSRWNGITLSIDEARAPHGLSIVVSPNVVDAATTLAYTLERAADVHISLADESGRVVATLADGRVEAGRHMLTVDTRALASGAYFLRMIVDGTTSTVPVKVLR